MPVNAEKALKVWQRYAYMRDQGHLSFVEKADKCDRFFGGEFAGGHWESGDLSRLRAARRPAITINKILSTISNVMGEQIYNRSEIAFRPRSGSPESIANILTKVFKQISDNNQLDWKRSDVFADGVIRSRGFYDVRLDFTDQMEGEVRIDLLNSKNVLIDPDAEQYDPDSWNDVIITKWLTADDISVLYSEDDAELLRGRNGSTLPFGYDSIDRIRNRFGNNTANYYTNDFDESNVLRNIRVIERQSKRLDNQKHFMAPSTGDMRPIPEGFDRNRIAWFVEKFGFKVVKKLVHRIRWEVVADNVVLHDDWSPYKHFTVVPYFPFFRHGTTIGMVENLLGPQELLNKVSSQELHVVNTTANSGWKVKSGAVTNMSVEELEQRGAETGLVIETSGDPDTDVVKITPNQIPSGLDRISYKAEEHIKTISGVPDSAQGMDREDVAAKAIQTKRQASQTNNAKPMDSLVRSDYMLARNVLDLVQEFYSEERIMTITKDRVTGETETFTVNQMTDEGRVVNDLTIGEYSVVISSVPQRETLEDSQFDQALAMREQGVNIPDEVLIANSRLIDKKDILDKMAAAAADPMNKRMKEAEVRTAEAEADKTAAEALRAHADAGLKEAKAGKEVKEMHEPPENDGGAALAKTAADIQLDREKFEHEQQMDYAELAEKRRGNQVDEALKAHDLEEKREDQRVADAQAAAQAASQPQEGAQA